MQSHTRKRDSLSIQTAVEHSCEIISGRGRNIKWHFPAAEEGSSARQGCSSVDLQPPSGSACREAAGGGKYRPSCGHAGSRAVGNGGVAVIVCALQQQVHEDSLVSAINIKLSPSLQAFCLSIKRGSNYFS